MKAWKDTVASECRYGEVAGGIWHDWNIIWEDSDADYQGHATFLAEKDGRFCFYEWWYGSCSGCDGWEADGASDKDIAKEMRDTAIWLDDRQQLTEWLARLSGKGLSNYSMERGGGLTAGIDILGGGLTARTKAMVKAARAYLAETPQQDRA